LLIRFDARFLKDQVEINKTYARRTDFLRREGLIGPGEEITKYTDDFLLNS
jgi:hypothetical protein